MRMVIGVAVALSLVFGVVKCDGGSLPGKPVLVNCRSPEKETFTCWWTPGSDGGLTTTHRLFYHKENSDGTFECPDYRSAGDNACFFDRSHTSVWVSYWVRVEASNALGNTTSETLEVDVVDIVQPSSPENVTVLLETLEGNPFLHVKWQPPPETDISSGWVTLIYQLRVKTAGEEKWEEYLSGKQAHFNIHSLHSGEEYMVQVRCKLDHGHWSAWSDITYAQLHNYALKQTLFWTLASVIVIFLITAFMCFLIVKRKKVKQWLLPPIPGPKIRGFDWQPLQSRYSEQVLYGLIHQGFPPTPADRHQEECLVVSDGEDGLVPDVQKAHIRKRSLIIPGFYQLSLVTCEGGSAHGLAHGPKAVESEASPGDTVNRSSAPGEDLNIAPTEEQSRSTETSGEESTEGPAEPDGHPGVVVPGIALGSFKETGYVGAEEPEKGVQVANEKLDYSRVSGVNSDNVLVLEKGNVPLTSRCQKKGNHMEATDQAALEKDGVCVGLLDNGYVDSIPALTMI
ncbi:unnamed protein product [Merluccius merluccius]